MLSLSLSVGSSERHDSLTHSVGPTLLRVINRKAGAPGGGFHTALGRRVLRISEYARFHITPTSITWLLGVAYCTANLKYHF